MRNENFEAKSNRQTNIAGYSLTNRWAEFHLVEHLFSLPSRPPPPSIRENPSRSPWSLSFPGKASFARRFERLISQPTGGQNTRVYKASDPRDAINYSATESATINLSSGREREKRKEREKKRKEGRKTHLAEEVGGVPTRGDSQRWSLCTGSSLREENRCSTDSSAIPLSSLAPNPTLSAWPYDSLSVLLPPYASHRRTDKDGASVCGWKQKVSGPLRRDGVKARASFELLGIVYAFRLTII